MRVNVIGSGYMGKQIAALLATVGFDSLIWQRTDDNLSEEINKEIRKIEKILKLRSKGSVKVINELNKLEKALQVQGTTIIPTRLLIAQNGKAKLKILFNLNFIGIVNPV